MENFPEEDIHLDEQKVWGWEFQGLEVAYPKALWHLFREFLGI